jgi:hypothetical protein
MKENTVNESVVAAIKIDEMYSQYTCERAASKAVCEHWSLRILITLFRCASDCRMPDDNHGRCTSCTLPAHLGVEVIRPCDTHH